MQRFYTHSIQILTELVNAREIVFRRIVAEMEARTGNRVSISTLWRSLRLCEKKVLTILFKIVIGND